MREEERARETERESGESITACHGREEGKVSELRGHSVFRPAGSLRAECF